MSTFTITLNNGRQLSGIVMNGSMFVSKAEITADDLSRDALKTVTIAEVDGDKTNTTILVSAVCDAILHWPEGWLFNIRERSEAENNRARIESLLDDLTNTQMALCDVYEMIGG